MHPSCFISQFFFTFLSLMYDNAFIVIEKFFTIKYEKNYAYLACKREEKLIQFFNNLFNLHFKLEKFSMLEIVISIVPLPLPRLSDNHSHPRTSHLISSALISINLRRRVSKQ